MSPEALPNALEPLRESLNQIQALFDAMEDMVYICDKNYRIWFMNRAMREHFGEERINEPCYTVLYDLSEVCPWCGQKKVLKGKTVRVDFTSPRNGGTYEIIQAPLRQADGEVFAAGIIRNITERKAMAAGLLESERYRAIADMTRDVSHHFNNLLTSIMGNIQMSLISLDNAKSARSFLEIATTTARRMAQLIKDMVMFAGEASGTGAMCDLNEGLERAISALAPLWKDRKQREGHYIEFVKDLTRVPLVRGDSADWTTVFVHILRNAIEAIETDGTIKVRSQRSDMQGPGGKEMVEVTISDNGRGMDADTLKRAVDPLFSTKTTVAAGMGLSVAHGIIKKNNGILRLQSLPGKGTTVYVTVPVFPAKTSEEKRPAGALSVEDISGIKILVVEHDDHIRELLAQMLHKEGYGFSSTKNPFEALDLFEKDLFHIILVDFGMPGMNGFEFAKKVKKVKPKTTVLLMTGWDEDEVRSRMPGSAIDGVIYKPFDLESVKEQLRQVVSNAE